MVYIYCRDQCNFAMHKALLANFRKPLNTKTVIHFVIHMSAGIQRMSKTTHFIMLFRSHSLPGTTDNQHIRANIICFLTLLLLITSRSLTLPNHLSTLHCSFLWVNEECFSQLLGHSQCDLFY